MVYLVVINPSTLAERNESLARLLQHVSEPRLHQVRYYGYYSTVARAHRGADAGQAAGTDSSPLEPTAVERKRLRRSRAHFLRRIDLLVCRVIRKILHHLGKKRSLPATAPPNTRATAIS
jgi:hypothetical protein